MRKYKTYQKILICTAPLFLLVILYFAAHFIIEHFKFPPCFTYSVISLLNGDILLSLRQNLLVITGIIIAVLFYTEFAVRACGKNIRFSIYNEKFVYGILIFLAVYFVARNFIPQIAPI